MLLSMNASVASLAADAQSSVRVIVSGNVSHAGSLELPASSRLSTAIDAAGVSHDAYNVGAAWYRARLRLPQQRLKAGIMFNLNLLAQPGAGTLQPPTLASAAQALLAWTQSLPVTGRSPAVKLDPDLVEISQRDNYPLENGDRLDYPTRPTSVRIDGAVQRPCTLPQRGLQDVHVYMASCPSSNLADKDKAYLIEPDGSVLTLGIALWNRSAPTSMAPGSILFIPFDDRVMARYGTLGLNREIADFLATQAFDSLDVLP